MSKLPVILMVAEKPSICNSIAGALAGGLEHCRSRGRTPPVHEFEGKFQGRRVTFRVTSVTGHVFSADFPKEYQDWESVAPASLFRAPVQSLPTRGSIVTLLKNEGRGVDALVLWLDCDREGENICFEVIRCVKPSMSSTSAVIRGHGGGKTGVNTATMDSRDMRIFRAKFSAVNREDIVKAMASLGVPNKNESDAVDARQELDLKVGVAFSRFQTMFFQGRYADLDARCISYGPCQSPTLGFCVRRHLEILHFQPETYWTISAAIVQPSRAQNGNGSVETCDERDLASGAGSDLQLEWGRGRVFAKKPCRMLFERVVARGELSCSSVLTREVKQGRPVPMNTVALLKICSKALGIGPHDCMRVAENLYLQGYLSYPRTESTAYPKSFDVGAALKSLAGHSDWGSYVSRLLEAGFTRPKGGVDMGDHPPITPCRLAQPGQLSGKESRVYDLVARHFIATASPDAIFQQTKVEFVGGGDVDEDNTKSGVEDDECFTLSARILVSPGFLEIQRWHRRDESGRDGAGQGKEEGDDAKLPNFRVGEVIRIIGGGGQGSAHSHAASEKQCKVTFREGMTRAPDYLTESELITLMERNGIGTDASIPAHIENVQKRNYVELKSGRRLVPTRLGIVLVQGYLRIDPDLVLPRIRANIETACDLIASGQAKSKSVVAHSLRNFERKFAFFCSRISRMDDLFSSSFHSLSPAQAAAQRFTRCGLTRQYLQYIRGPPARLYNAATEQLYALPSGGSLRQFSGRLCDREGCAFELSLYVVGSHPQRCYPFCPYCYNNPIGLAEEDTKEDDVTGDERAETSGSSAVNSDSVALSGTASSSATSSAEAAATAAAALSVSGGSACLECPLPDSHPTVQSMRVCDDPESGGCFILDPSGGPKWRLISTRSAFCVHFPKKRVKSVTVLGKKDEATGCHWIRLEFQEGQVPQEILAKEKGKGKTIKSYSGCLLTDPILHQFLHSQEGSNVRKRAGGRRGGGRRRGGRRKGR